MITEERRALAARAVALRKRGHTTEQIAIRLDVSRSYAGELCSDPDGMKAKARKNSYRGICERCGGPTTGSEGRTARPRHCQACTHALQKRWTREAIIEAIQRFAAVHGRRPYASEWVNADPVNGYPSASSVYKANGANPSAVFDQWADAIEAAGFPRPRVGKRDGQRDWSAEAVIEAMRMAAKDGVVSSSGSLHAIAITYFGTWAAACEAAGLTPWYVAHGWTPERVIATFRGLADGALAPKYDDVPPSFLSACSRVFGSVTAAIDAAGLIRVPRGPGARERIKQSVPS